MESFFFNERGERENKKKSCDCSDIMRRPSNRLVYNLERFAAISTTKLFPHLEYDNNNIKKKRFVICIRDGC